VKSSRHLPPMYYSSRSDPVFEDHVKILVVVVCQQLPKYLVCGCCCAVVGHISVVDG
jgi:hypothetical protein